MTVAVVGDGTASTVLKPEDLEITSYRGSGPGGQHRNTSDTGVRVRHIPTGLVTKVDKGRSWWRNRQDAIAEMERRLADAESERAAASLNQARVEQIGAGERASNDWVWCAWRNTVTNSRTGKKYPMDRALQGRVRW